MGAHAGTPLRDAVCIVTGGGLSLVRSIMETAGGRLEITSRLAEGATVRLHWPG
jgi:signal transduction histidine kinase